MMNKCMLSILLLFLIPSVFAIDLQTDREYYIQLPSDDLTFDELNLNGVVDAIPDLDVAAIDGDIVVIGLPPNVYLYYYYDGTNWKQVGDTTDTLYGDTELGTRFIVIQRSGDAIAEWIEPEDTIIYNTRFSTTLQAADEWTYQLSIAAPGQTEAPQRLGADFEAIFVPQRSNQALFYYDYIIDAKVSATPTATQVYPLSYDAVFNTPYIDKDIPQDDYDVCTGSNQVFELTGTQITPGSGSPVCFGDLSCSYEGVSCPAGTQQVLRFDGSGNAQLFGDYPNTVCCSSNYANTQNMCQPFFGTQCPASHATGLFSYTNRTNAHVDEYEVTTEPKWQMCCDSTQVLGETVIKQDEACIAPQGRLFSFNHDAESIERRKHISLVNDFADPFEENLCFQPEVDQGITTCIPRGGSCIEQEVCIGSVYTSKNSQYGRCGEGDINLCCNFNNRAPLWVDGVEICGIDYFCGDDDGVCPELFEGKKESGERVPVSCRNVFDPDCEFNVDNPAANVGTRYVDLAFNLGEPIDTQIIGLSNSDEAEFEYVEYSNGTHYLAQVEVESIVSSLLSYTTISFDNAPEFPPTNVYFDLRTIFECSALPLSGHLKTSEVTNFRSKGSPVQKVCYTVDEEARSITIQHPLSPHVISVLFEQSSNALIYILLACFLLVTIAISLVRGKVRRLIQKEDEFIGKLENYVIKELEHGTHPSKIRENLLAVGWSKHQVDRHIKKHHKH